MADRLTLRQLRVNFPDSGNVLRGLSLSIAEGTVTGIVGTSGSGKSLTAWMILGLAPENANVDGRIAFHDDDQHIQILDGHRFNRNLSGRKVVMIPQNPFTSLNPVFKCGWQAGEKLKTRGMRPEEIEQRVLSIFREMSFEDPERIYDSYPFELSGGQLQRVVIAMALLVDPVLIVADEPTTALDSITRTVILELLTNWTREHQRNLLLISHDVLSLTRYCEEIFVLKAGKIHRHISGESEEARQSDPFVTTQIKSLSTSGDQKTAFAEEEDFILEVEALHKTFAVRNAEQTVTALQDVSFRLGKGECLGIVGPSGCGKSTLARTLSGLVALDRGTVFYRRAATDPHELHNRIQMIFQDPYSALYPHKTVGEFVAEAVILHQGLRGAVLRREVQDLLAQVSLPASFITRHPKHLSGGERQRVQIARALAVRPEILICDECIAGLDVPVQAEMIGLLNNLRQRRGMAVIMISHDLRVVRFMAQRIMVMAKGRIIEHGTPHEIFEDPQHPTTKALIHAIPVA